MTKKRSSEILADENGKFFREKVKCYKFSKESKKNSKTGGKSETGGKCIMVSGGMDAPAIIGLNGIEAIYFYSSIFLRLHRRSNRSKLLIAEPQGAVHKVRHARGGQRKCDSL